MRLSIRLIFFIHFAAMCVAVTSAAGAFSVDFSSPAAVVRHDAAWTLDGAYARSAVTNGVRTLSLAPWPGGATPFRLSFKARGRGLVMKGGHWGFGYRTADGCRFFTWANPNGGFIHEITDAKKVKVASGVGGKRALDWTGKTTSWTEIALEADSRGYVFTMDGEACYSGDRSILGVDKFTFHSYGVGVELKDVTFEPLPERKPSGGAVMAWMRPGGPGDLLRLVGEDGAQVVRAQLAGGFATVAVAPSSKGGKPVTFARIVTDMRYRGEEWFHVAFSWNDSHKGMLFVNGIPYATGLSFGEKGGSLLGTAIGRVARMEAKGANVRDAKFSARPLAAHEIAAEYRRSMPVDIVIRDAFVPAGEKTSVSFTLAPGGHYTRPNPVASMTNMTATVRVSSSVAKVGGGKIEPIAESSRGHVEVDVDRVRDVPAAELALAPGLYRLAVTVSHKGGEYIRNLFFTAANRVDVAAKPATDSPLEKGEVIAEKTFAAPYREAGSNGGDRFSEILTLPKDALGRPCLLEIDWPDDKPRVFGLYLYEELAASCRDHLQQGLAAGGVIPNTGKIQTAEYLYWPNTTNQLFEARTLVKGRPAAVSAIRFRRLPNGLPRLRVRRPKGLPGRTFGHCDEDQTFDNNLTSAALMGTTAEVLPRLVDYFAYTGQNAFHYSTMRYSFMQYGPIEGASRYGAFPRRPGELPEIVRTLGANGIEFVPQMVYGNDPAIAKRGLIESDDKEAGRVMLDRDGRDIKIFGSGGEFANIANPSEQDRFLSLFTDVLADLSTNGVDRILVCLENSIGSPFCWPGENAGFDEWTLARFRRETGAKKPEGETWNRWRAKVVTEYFSKFCGIMRAARPDIRIIAEISPNADRYAKRGVDLDAIAKIPNVEFAVIRWNSNYWFKLFQGKSEPDSLETLYDFDSERHERLRRLCGGSVPQVYSYPTYFETFTKPPTDDRRFGNYFQNADVKPWGRHFLREPAFAVAALDALNYAIGMQPLGSWGSDEAVREFTRAYCALPALPFSDMDGSRDPVVGRFRETANGVYFYAVNMHCSPVAAELGFGRYSGIFGRVPEFVDLSSGSRLRTDRIELKAYELRSFLIPRAKGGSSGRGMAVRARVAESARRSYDERRSEVRSAIGRLAAVGDDVSTAQNAFDLAETALASGRLAEAHRLYHSSVLNRAVNRARQSDDVAAESKMHQSGRWAVNCGGTAYTRVGGKLFSPDREWDGGTFGHYGAKATVAVRDADTIPPGDPLSELYLTEAYNVDGYKFKLPPGRYAVTIRAKWAYPRAFRPDRLKVEYFANGKSVAGPVDFHAAQGGDITRTRPLETVVDIGDGGILDLSAKAAPGADPTFRLFNAIEIERTK